MTISTPLGPAAEGEWLRLRTQLEFAKGFWLGFVFIASVTTSRVFEQRGERWLRQHVRTLRIIEANDTVPSDEILSALLDESFDEDCIWVRSLNVVTQENYYEQLWNLFSRLNERRDAVRRHHKGGVVFALHPSMKALVRDAAPDLWSVRALVLEPGLSSLPSFDRRSLPAQERYIRTEQPDPLAATPVSNKFMREMLNTAANLLLEDRPQEATEVIHRALATTGPDTAASDLATALVWASRAEEAAGDEAAAAEHAGQALRLLRWSAWRNSLVSGRTLKRRRQPAEDC